jgi:MFS family permease
VRDIWQFCAILFAVGWIITPLNSSAMTILQTAVRNDMRGRIGAAMNTLTTSTNLLSMALAGVLGDALGVRMVFIIGGACVAIAGLASGWLFRGTARAAHPEPEALTA